MPKILRQYSRKLHLSLAWLAAFSLLAFVLSGLTHILMVWTGPEAKRHKAPTIKLNASNITAVQTVIKRHHLQDSKITKVVKTKDGLMLQVTEEIEQARRYFSLDNLQEYLGYDEQQAIWLARYYTGNNSEIKQVEFITTFSNEYPWVNRLLPVYRVSFSGSDDLSAFIYTETNTLASISNAYKESLQTVFQIFHTWSFLDAYPIVRIMLISVLMFSLLFVLLTAIVMLVSIKRKTPQPITKQLHRKLAVVVVIPCLAFVISGIYHLYQNELVDNLSGIHLSKAIPLDTIDWQYLDTTKLSDTEKNISSLSIINYKEQAYLRASFLNDDKLPKSAHAHHQKSEKEQRFDGKPQQNSALYLPLTADPVKLNDAIYSEYLARNFLSLDADVPLEANIIKRFGADYDFRNKRLPVWQFIATDHHREMIFIDPISGILVDRSQSLQQAERWSFSLLHKWGFFRAFASREIRDGVMAVVLLMTVLLTVLGIGLKWQRR